MNFQIHSKNLFLTYAECPIDKQIAFDFLTDLLKPTRLLVAREKHQNGNYHLHAYCSFETAFRTRNPRFADMQGHHGNYQGCRSPKNVLKYCTKEDDYLANFDLDEIMPKASGRSLLGKRVLDGEDLWKIVEEMPQHVFGYKRLKEDIQEFRRDKQESTIELEIPGEVPNPWGFNLYPDTDLKKCHYWFYSTVPNKGKTTGVINPLIRDHHAVMYHPKATYHHVREKTRVIVLDEVITGTIKARDLNEICDGNAQFRVFMGGEIKLKEKALVVICSNFSIDTVFPIMKEFVHARFNEFCVDNY